MYVCICNPVTDSQVRQAINAGCRSLGELQTQLGVANVCGRCSECAAEMLRESVNPSSGGCRNLAK